MKPLLPCGLLLIGLFVPFSAQSDEEVAVTIDNFTFSPVNLNVTKGAEVTWTNKDDIPHSIVLTAIGVQSKAFDTDKTFAYRFDKAGIFAYICGLHPQMHGQIVVQ